jgi:hypothetical protein
MAGGDYPLVSRTMPGMIAGMSHPLDGARFKIVWAQKHLDSLKPEIRRYLDEQPDEIRSQPHMHPQHPWLGPTHVLAPIVPTKTGLELSGIVGDIVTNTRAALDYIMWELAQRYFVPPLARSKDWRLASFPISETPTEVKDRFNSLADRKLPADAIREIKAVQPYNAGYEPLLLLTQLVNQDKHRMLLPTIGEVGDLTIEFAPSELLGFRQEAVTIPQKDLAAIGTTAFQSDMQMKGKAAIYVTLKDVAVPPESVDRTLEQIIKCVVDIIPRFDRFFA